MKSPTPTKPTINSLIDDFDDDLTVLNPDDEEYDGLKKGFKQSLLQLVLEEVIGEDEHIMGVLGDDDYLQDVAKNELKAELRQRAKELLKWYDNT